MMSHSTTNYFRYLTVGDRDIQWGLYVTGAGCTVVPPGIHYPPAVHPEVYHFAWERGRVLPEHQIVYITRGEGEFESAKAGKKKITAGNVFLLFPGEWHRYRPNREIGWDEYWVSYNGDYPDRLVKHGFISPENPVLQTGLDDAILHPYVNLLDQVRSEPVGYQQLIAADTTTILAAVLAAVRSRRNGGRIDAMVRRAKLILEQQPEELASMERLAAELNLSPTHFHRLFREHTGLSPYQYHLQLRINRAKEMLHGTNLSIKQIAAALGFENPYHFSKTFKKKTGMSPSKWRGGGH